MSLLIVDCSDKDLHTPVGLHSNQAILSTPTDKHTHLTFSVY